MHDTQTSMRRSKERRPIDIGRLIAVTIFSALLALNAMALLAGPGRHGVLGATTSVLTLAFYVLLIVAYLRRSPTDKTDRHWGAWLIALLATGAPFSIPLVSTSGRPEANVATVAAVVLAIGLAAMLWSLGALGTNISVVPQARSVVAHGPYAWVRHPLYTAELINVTGLCLATTGGWPWLVLAALVTLQVLRARREEALLSRELPDYAAYQGRTPMLIPLRRRAAG